MAVLSGVYKQAENPIPFPPEVVSLIDQAWEVRSANFPKEITFVSPVRTAPVSLTGSDCALDCAHCGKHYLKAMLRIEVAEAALEKDHSSNATSFLISGGYTLEGKVPFMQHVDDLLRIGEKARLNLHTGLVTRDDARVLADIADVASFDFPASEEIIRRVYGLDRSIKDYVNSYRALIESMGKERVVPHVTIGLLEGRITKDLEAVKILAAEGISRLVLLVFRPTPGTRFGTLPPPGIWETAEVIARIRIMLPQVPLFLGCMRPGGKYRAQVDELAIGCGTNKIVLPAPGLNQLAREYGLEIKYEEECCAL